ncbi:MAG: YraN family protein [Woeseiaceae bacterium]|nr:YraN family protein [Woeseiaceae bacterium]NNL63181.1 YraN family protein [Woeseiaceae bacterium]
MARRSTGAVGRRAERLACRYLEARGLRPVAQNFRRRGGEIDLLMLEDACLVVVEVRYRKSSAFIDPELTVDRHKQRRLVRTAALFLARHRHFAGHAMRFDVVSIEGHDKPRVRWIRDAFRPDDSKL